MLTSFLCRAKQVLRRRLLWPLLLLAGAIVYPAQIAWQTASAANEAAAAAATEALARPGAKPGDVLEAAAQAASIVRAQVVSPTYLASKMSTSVGVFVLIMFLGWGALQAVMPVLPDWATGRYREDEHWQAAELSAPVRGFKGTFLGPDVSPLARIWLFMAGLTLLLLVAGIAVWAGFSIQ